MSASQHAHPARPGPGRGPRLAYAEYGAGDGVATFYFHGHPGSRLEGRLVDAAARRAGVRLIAVDRPGIGRSAFQPGRCLLDWPARVSQLADRLGLECFAVVGVSGGGPYALACAYRIPQRLRACAVVGGLGPLDVLGIEGMMPLDRLQFHVARAAPWLLRPVLWLVVGRLRRRFAKRRSLDRTSVRLAREIIAGGGDREQAAAYVRAVLEAFRQGTRGMARDAVLYTRPWGFAPSQIAFAPVHLWHGGRDRHVPVRMARAVADAIPRCVARFFPEDDHLSSILGHVDEVLATLAASRPARGR